MKVWASAKTIRQAIAEVPENWLDRFACAQMDDTRKFGAASNSRLLFRVAAVLAAIEERKYFKD